MVGALFGTNALAAGLDEKIQALTDAFRQHRFLIVWDNFEVVCGIPGTSLAATLSADDRQRLLGFLRGLRGGQSKVLVTSRSEEEWLDAAHCYKLSIGGLEGEERWEYCDAIVRDLGLTVDRTDPDWTKLMDLLEGHPLAMRVVLPRLQKHPPRRLMELIESNLAAFASEDQESAKLFATLGFAKDGLPPDLQPLLIPLALHERFVDGDLLEAMARQLDAAFDGGRIDRLTGALGVAGLLRDRGNRIYEMHPALSRFLRLGVLDRTANESRDAWCRAFVDVLGTACRPIRSEAAARAASGIPHPGRELPHRAGRGGAVGDGSALCGVDAIAGRVRAERAGFSGSFRPVRTTGGTPRIEGVSRRPGRRLSPVGEDRPGATRLCGGRAVVSQIARDLREAGDTNTERPAAITSWG